MLDGGAIHPLIQFGAAHQPREREGEMEVADAFPFFGRPLPIFYLDVKSTHDLLHDFGCSSNRARNLLSYERMILARQFLIFLLVLFLVTSGEGD